MIFQQYALYPWMTVQKNVEFALKFRTHDKIVEKKDPRTGEIKKEVRKVKYTKQERQEMARHYIQMVNLTGFENSYPSGLSGGMKQRVALARGYSTASDVLLMDEPFGALDAQTRAQLQEDLLKSWAQEKKTCMFITHDVEEAVLLATKVVIMSARPGRIKSVIDIDLPYPRNQPPKWTKNLLPIRMPFGSRFTKIIWLFRIIRMIGKEIHMKKLVALALALALALMLLVGCGGTPTSSQAPAGSSGGTDAPAESLGTVRYAMHPALRPPARVS